MLPLRKTTILPAAAVAIATLALGASGALAHPGHDEEALGAQSQSTFRRGLHGADDGLADDSLQADPPTTGRGLRGGSLHGNAGGGIGGLQGNGFGRYGAGSVGQPGPGGIGGLKTGGMGTPPRPR